MMSSMPIVYYYDYCVRRFRFLMKYTTREVHRARYVERERERMNEKQKSRKQLQRSFETKQILEIVFTAHYSS